MKRKNIALLLGGSLLAIYFVLQNSKTSPTTPIPGPAPRLEEIAIENSGFVPRVEKDYQPQEKEVVNLLENPNAKENSMEREPIFSGTFLDYIKHSKSSEKEILELPLWAFDSVQGQYIHDTNCWVPRWEADKYKDENPNEPMCSKIQKRFDPPARSFFESYMESRTFDILTVLLNPEEAFASTFIYARLKRGGCDKAKADSYIQRLLAESATLLDGPVDSEQNIFLADLSLNAYHDFFGQVNSENQQKEDEIFRGFMDSLCSNAHTPEKTKEINFYFGMLFYETGNKPCN